MKKRKAKAKAAAEVKAPEPKKREAKDLPAREVLPNVTAIVLKKGPVAIGERQVVYETPGAIAVWDRDLKKEDLTRSSVIFDILHLTS